MATKRLLVDAIHPEETRIVVTNGNRLEEFDFESATRRQLRGNIYLAKVTRVEPSLQAAFVEYGGNRHGFLAFSEIHPDYYQIPVADREALLRAQEEAEADEEEEDDHEAPAAGASAAPAVAEAEVAEAEDDSEEDDSSEDSDDEEPGSDTPREMLAAVEDPSVEEPAPVPAEASAEEDPQSNEPAIEQTAGAGSAKATSDDEDEHSDDASHIEEAPHHNEPVESIGGGGGDAHEETRRKPTISRRNNYKIQEVIKRRQVMLVQVVKEERGNKGAALTTYLSLAGRYSVLMPNTARGGGISRKITNAADRKRLKDIVGDLDIPTGQGIILRTAGASRTKAEVKRDFEYLQRLWENVRTLTLQSVAPCVVYEEGSLIKRTIRDLYNKDIDEVWVAGDDAYREAKDFMRMIMPSHAKNVQVYKDDQPIFSKYGVENQLDQMFSPQVTLPSGGYIVINPTEALVSIDVNSGRSTKEHNIEDTALQTNLEAADEVARQLRLRDLAGLIVIDFIDMVENRSNRAVERRLKDALKNDRARIQVGRISHFGLMEMSRQRIRFGVVESSTHKCPVCDGTGIVRSVESVALLVMRAVEDHVLRKPGQSINVKVPTDVALYILNTKRSTLNALEARHNLSITIVADDHVGSSHYAIERGEARADRHAADPGTHVRVDSAAMAEIDDAAIADEEEEVEETEAREGGDNGGNGERQGGRKRRRRGRGRDRDERRDGGQQSQQHQQTAGSGDSESEDDADGEGRPQSQQAAGEPRGDGEGDPRRRRRRGRRGGRRNRRPEENGEAVAGAHGDADAGTTEDEVSPAPVQPAVIEDVAAAVLAQDAIAEASDVAAEVAAEDAPKPRRARRSRKTDTAVAEAPEGTEAAAGADAPAAEARPKSRRRTKAAPPTEAEVAESAEKLVEMTTGEAAAAALAPAEVAEAAPEARRPRKELPEEGVIVTSSSAGDGEAKPKKAGWWKRTFGA